MAKFSLDPNPTFKAKVQIPIPGGDDVPVEFTFKHRTRDDVKAFIDTIDGRSDVDLILDIAEGWELADAFNRDSVEKLTQNYHGSASSVFETYIEELGKARKGN